jgi:catechol 2,3-dioxygenase-like lactoylglutathione lyase family enzyme
MTSTPQLNGLLEIAIYVEDIARSAAFYQRVLGLDVIFEGDRLWALGVPGRQILLICLRNASANLPVIAHDAVGPQHFAFAVSREDLDAWRQHLDALGVPIEHIHDWPRGGRSVYFRDPDGHIVELATPGVWSIY